jgi:hypothetical protein
MLPPRNKLPAVSMVTAARRNNRGGSRPLLGERAAAVARAGLIDARAQPRVAREIVSGGEAADVADLGGDGVAEHPRDPGDGHEQGHVAVRRPELAQCALELGDAAVEFVDEGDGRVHVAAPRLGQAALGEQRPAAHAEEIRDGTLHAVGEEGGVDAVLRRERWRTRCSRNRARSRSARTSGSGSQIAGTRSRRESSAKTRASMRSVLHGR